MHVLGANHSNECGGYWKSALRHPQASPHTATIRIHTKEQYGTVHEIYAEKMCPYVLVPWIFRAAERAALPVVEGRLKQTD